MHELFAKMGARLLEEIRKYSAPIDATKAKFLSDMDAAEEAQEKKLTNFETEMKRTKSPTAVEKLPRVITVTK